MSYRGSGGGRRWGGGPNRGGGRGRGRASHPPGLTGREIGLFYKEKSQAKKREKEKNEVCEGVRIVDIEIKWIHALRIIVPLYYNI